MTASETAAGLRVGEMIALVSRIGRGIASKLDRPFEQSGLRAMTAHLRRVMFLGENNRNTAS